MAVKVIRPQPGPQEQFMANPADIIIFGGAAGGGKSYALLMDPLRYMKNQRFGAVIFRNEYKQIFNQGGLWDTSEALYGQIKGAVGRMSVGKWTFKSGAKVEFDYLNRKDDLKKWQGSQIAMIGFDELTHFTEYMFFYMLSRNRSTCGVKPYVRATCNPDADSWVATFISWWINQDTGYPIPERSGKIRWMVRIAEKIHWFDTREEAVTFAKSCNVKDHEAEEMPKSVTFILSTLEDNKILMENDPGYLANLLAMTEVEMERLLRGNWKIKAAAGKFFKRTQIGKNGLLSQIPDDVVFWCRAWDMAATSEDEDGNADYTAGVLFGKRRCGRYLVADVINQQLDAGDVETIIYNTARSDRAKYGFSYRVRLAQDPGQAGKSQAKQYMKLLAGFDVSIQTVSGSKEVRANPLAAQWQHGNVDVLIGEWNDMYFNQMESFPESIHDDMVDASSDAFDECANNTFSLGGLT